MGFYATLLVVHGRTQTVSKTPTLEEVRRDTMMPVKHYTMWEAQEAVAFGRVTRIEKVERHSGKEVAGICIASYLFEKLSAKLKCVDKSNFAPRFAIGDEKNDTSIHWEYDRLTFDMLTGGEQFVRPLNPLNAHSTCPAFETMLGHNKYVALPDAEFLSFIKDQYDVILSNLLMWESCATVARWFADMEDNGSRSWQVMSGDDRALCYWRAWKNFLYEMGKLEARSLFVFDRSADLAFF